MTLISFKLFYPLNFLVAATPALCHAAVLISVVWRLFILQQAGVYVPLYTRGNQRWEEIVWSLLFFHHVIS